MKLFENEYVTIAIDENIPCLEWIGKQYMPSAEFRASEEKLLQFYQKYKKKYPTMQVCIDARLVGVVSPKDTQWVAEVILPQVIEAGLTKEGFVVSEGLSKMTITHYKSATGKSVEIAMFPTVEAAKNWLKESR